MYKDFLSWRSDGDLIRFLWFDVCFFTVSVKDCFVGFKFGREGGDLNPCMLCTRNYLSLVFLVAFQVFGFYTSFLFSLELCWVHVWSAVVFSQLAWNLFSEVCILQFLNFICSIFISFNCGNHWRTFLSIISCFICHSRLRPTG